MQSIDFIASISRRLATYPSPLSYISSLLYRIFSKHIDVKESWVIIDDYDRDLKLRIDRSAYIGGVIFWYGMHSRVILRYIDQILKPDMVFADIGANQGGFTIFAAKRLVNGKVLAFEPGADIYEQLTENVRLNSFDNIVLFNFALFDKKGKADIFSEEPNLTLGTYNEGLPSLFKTHKQSIKLGEVELKTLDSVFEQNKYCRLDVIKIDVEGAELMVLRGAAATLKRFKPIIIFEASPEFFSTAGYTVDTVFDFLNNLGYRFHRLGQRGDLVEIQDRRLLSQCDVICLPTKENFE